MTDFLERWATESDENAKLVAQERLFADVTEAIWKAMEDEDISKTELANRMGSTKGFVSQVLSGFRNMTLRTLSDICFALKKRPTIAVKGESHGGEWQTLDSKVTVAANDLLYKRTGNVVSPMDRWQNAA